MARLIYVMPTEVLFTARSLLAPSGEHNLKYVIDTTPEKPHVFK